MTSSVDVIVLVEAGGRPLLRTVDSLLRQRVEPASVALVKSSRFPDPKLVASAADRLSAIVLDGSPYPGVTMNAAVRSGRGRSVVVLRAGLILDGTWLEHCEVAFDSDDSLSAIAPAVALRSPDGAGDLIWMPDVQSVASILSDTRSVPPVFAVQREAWNTLTGFDESLEGMVEYAFWLRLVSEGLTVRLLSEPLITRELDDVSVSSAENDGQRLHLFGSVLARYSSLVEREMLPLLVAREVRFGRLREIHRELLAQRDRDLAELDRIRADAAHHLAYLKHHGRDGFDWGELRRTNPVSRDWGYDRGTPIDRRYIDDFLFAHSSDVRGTVLEIQEDDSTLACGGGRVSDRAILDIDPSNSRATVVADLRKAPELATDAYDCIILTQTLHVIDDMGTALAECHRILRPGGVLLATFPSASRVCLEYGQHGDLWRMTPAGARALCESAFTPSEASYDTFGNVLTTAAFLQGLGCQELTDAEFEVRDPYFPLLTGVRAKKTERPARSKARGIVLLYHRIDDTPDIHGLGVPAAAFDAQLEWLRAECQVMPLDEMLRTPLEQLPDRAVALTFDDGYEDNLRVAVPLLQRHQAPAAFFLTSRWLEERGEYWWDTLERVLLSPTSVPAVLDIDLGGVRARLATANPEERLAAHRQLHEALVHAPLEERDRIVDLLRAWAGGGAARVRPMMADEVRQLAGLPGIAIGAHTVNHLALPDQPSARAAEVTRCQADLERVTDRRVDLFAYPYGAVDRECAALVRKGWRWGLSCDEGVLGDSFDAARVPRLDVKAWPPAAFASRVSRLLAPEAPARRRAITLAP